MAEASHRQLADGPQADPLEQLREFLRAVHVMKMYTAAQGLAIPETARKTIGALGELEAVVPKATDTETFIKNLPSGMTLESALALSFDAHAALSALVAPATPDSIIYTKPPESGRDFRKRQAIVFWLVFAALASIACFIISSTLGRILGEEKDAASTIIGKLVVPIEERLQALESAPAESSELPPDWGPTIDDLERQIAAVHDATEAVPELRGAWPDSSLQADLAKLSEQPTAAPPVLARMRESLTAFKGRLTAPSKRLRWPLLALDQLTNIFAAMLGAAFYTLYTANRYIVLRTFDRAYTTHYIARFVLGIVVGVILANFGENLLKNTVNDSPNETTLALTQTVLALIGGYSADAVNAIFTRIAETLTTLVRGDTGHRVREEAQADVKKAQIEAQKSQTEAALKVKGAKEEEKARLVQVMAQATASGAPQAVLDLLQEQIEALDAEG